MNERIKEERRQLILLTSLKVFTHKGFAASKMSDIAVEAKTSYGLLYYYFKSKDEIYTELLNHAATSAQCLIEKIDSEDISPLEKIHELAERVLTGIGQKSSAAYYFVLCVEALMSDANPKSAAEAVGHIMDPLQSLCRIVKQGQKQGQIRWGDPMEMAVAGFSMILGLSSMMISGKIEKLPAAEIFCRIFE